MDSNADFDVLHLQDMLDEYTDALKYSRYTHAAQTRQDIAKYCVAHYDSMQDQIDELEIEVDCLRDEVENCDY